jgi:formate--tetrahydrofolate ligase
MAAADVKPLLPVKTPVPSDIDIAQSVQPVHISKIADALGLKPEEYDLYGIHKAKASAGSAAGR